MTASTSRCYVPDGEIDKVGIDKYSIGRTKLSVVLKEKSTNCLLHLLWLGPFLDDGLLFLLFLFQVCTNASILGADDLFGDGKFTLLFCFPHISEGAYGMIEEPWMHRGSVLSSDREIIGTRTCKGANRIL
jgi:hypothetical protein